MRKNGRAIDIIMAVHGIGAPQRRDSAAVEARIDSRLGIGISQCGPVGGAGLFVVIRISAAPIEVRTKAVLAHIRHAHPADIGLDHLCHLLRQRHFGQQAVNFQLQRSICRRDFQLWPDRSGCRRCVRRLRSRCRRRLATGRYGERQRKQRRRPEFLSGEQPIHQQYSF